MRYLVLSDVHANDVALGAVLRDAQRRGYDAALFLGDAVGYGPAPEATVAALAELAPDAALLGNHDAHLLALVDGAAPPMSTGPGSVVGAVLERQAEALSPASVAWLRGLAEHHLADRYEAVHGALARPWQYLHGLGEASENLPHLRRPLCLVGHTHVPRLLAATDAPNGERLWRQITFREEGGRYRMPPRAKGFFNPGAVGQPRDGVPLASYALYDDATGALEVIRVAFDVVRVQRAVRDAGYPEALAARLALGR